LKIEQKDKEEKQQSWKASEDYRLLMEHTPLGVFLAGKEGNIKLVNSSLIKMLGSPSAEATKQINLFTFPLLKRAGILTATKRCIDSEEPSVNEFFYRSKWGKDVCARLYLNPVKDTSNHLIGIQGIVEDITSWKQLEEKLKESEEKYHQLFNKSPYPIGLFDLEGNIVDYNNATNFLLSSHILKDYIGINYREFWTYHEKNKPLIALFNEKFAEIIQTGKTLNFEFPIHRIIGGIISCYATASMINIGKKRFIQLILMDISAQKETQQRLKESEEKYKNLLENAHEGVWAVNENDDTIFVNPKLCEMLGYTKDEMMGTNLHVYLEDSMSEYINSFRKRRKKGLKDTYELEFIKKDGTILSTRVNAAPILKDNGEFKGSFAYITDITESKKAQQELIESEKKFRRIFESIPDLFFLVDRDTTILDHKGKEADLYLPPEQFLGKKLKDIMPAEIGELSLNAVNKTIKTQKPQLMEYSLPIKNKTRHFEARYLYFSEDRVAIFVREMTDRKKAVLLIKKEIQKLKELDQIRKNLISRVSHELKTPLVSVCGGTELLLNLSKNKFGKEDLELIELIEKGGKRLTRLVDNLLDITRIEYSKLELIKEPIDLIEIIRDCVKEMTYLIKKRDLKLEFDLSEEFILNIDKIRIEQVILNLLSNAIKNTPPKGIITIKSVRKGDWAEISVSDTGIGLTRAEMNRIFTRFGKIERYGEGLEYIDIQGSGLGLFISKEIMDLHEGQIRAESLGRNKGSTFIIKLPI
jgi:PAS domain S-box-containing protein